MATNLPSCFSIQFLEQLLTFLAYFTLLKYVKSQRSYGFLILIVSIVEELKLFWPFLSTNKTIGSTLDFALKDQLKRLKSDTVLRNHDKIVLMDVECSYDLYLNELQDRKQEIYSEVNFQVNKVFRCEVLPFTVGSTGLAHKKCSQTLMSFGIPKTQSKGLCKWCSNSNILFARKIWKVRCRLVNDN